jgi:hypothetical protein
MNWRPCLFFALVLLTVSGMLGAATLTVDSSGRGDYLTIQPAVDRTAPGDVVIINPGNYSGTGNRDIDLRGKAITIQGTAPEDPNVVAATIIDCKAGATDPHRGFIVSGCAGARIVGLTVTNGRATAGGAVYCTSSVLDLVNCRIVGNSTLAGDGKVTLNGGGGGGIYAESSSLQIVDCLISDNSTNYGTKMQTGDSGSGGDGGGIYATGTMVEIDGCTISNNHTGSGADSAATAGRGGDGGGVYADSLSLTDSNLADNTTGRGGTGVQGGRGGNGAAIFCRRGVIARTIIQGNIASSGGTSSGSGKVVAGPGGAGGGVFSSDSLLMTDCLVTGNGSGRAGLLGVIIAPASDGPGAGIWCAAGQIDHCTIASNSVWQSDSSTRAALGAGLFCTNQTTVSNSILWSNTPDQVAGQDCNRVTFCDIQDGLCAGSQGNVAVDPVFLSPGSWTPADEVTWTDRSTRWTPGDYHLSNTSTCIDAGDPAYTADVDAVDLAGLPRIEDGRVDMGAYEFKSLLPVYHFQASATSKHFYTAKESEKNKLLRAPNTSVWSYKGVAYYTYVRAVEPRLKPVYRLWSDKLGEHFFTAKESEKNKLLSGSSGVWLDEGVAWYAYLEGDRPAASKPVYRFWSGTLSGHYFTMDEAEKDRLSVEGSGWTFEGAAWYAFDTPEAAEEEKPVVESNSYSFTSGADGAIYQMTLKAVIDGREARIDRPTISFTPALGHLMMEVDLDAMTTSLTSLFLESEFFQSDLTATQSDDATSSSHTFTLSVYGFFNTVTPHGPYTIDPQSLSFPQGRVATQTGASEDFAIVGSVSLDGAKLDVTSTLEATSLEMQGTAVFDRRAYPDNLVMVMSGPFQWRREGHEDLLAEATVREHRIQLYVTSLTVQTTGTWSGKLADVEAQTSK